MRNENSSSRSRAKLVVSRLLSARSTRPWRRRLSPAYSSIWLEKTDAPSLVLLAAGLAK